MQISVSHTFIAHICIAMCTLFLILIQVWYVLRFKVSSISYWRLEGTLTQLPRCLAKIEKYILLHMCVGKVWGLENNKKLIKVAAKTITKTSLSDKVSSKSMIEQVDLCTLN